MIRNDVIKRDVIVRAEAQTIKKRCTCKSEYQDEKYGKGIRVHNKTGISGVRSVGQSGWRCTVCGRDK